MPTRFNFVQYLITKMRDAALPSPHKMSEGWKTNNMSFLVQALKLSVLIGVLSGLLVTAFSDFGYGLTIGYMLSVAAFCSLFFAFIVADKLRCAKKLYLECPEKDRNSFASYVVKNTICWFIPSPKLLVEGWKTGNVLPYVDQVGKLAILTMVLFGFSITLLFGATAALFATVLAGFILFAVMFYALVFAIKMRKLHKDYDEQANNPDKP